MGIQGLLPLLKDIHNPTHIKEYKGKTLGIDAYVWLHRGAYACAQELVLGQPTDKFIRYTMHKINMLRHFGITPYMVFDGDKLPSKAHTEDDRDRRRTENRARAEQCLAAGEKDQARELFSKCLDVSPAIAYQLIKALKREKVSYIVAPYEADAQLAYLEKEGIIDGIITEDSDMLVFGCKRVLFKLDSDGGCVEILQSKLTANKSVSFVGWTIHEFRQMSILSGCDYLESIIGMGLKNAHRLLRRYKTVDKVLQAVRLEGKLRVPPTYAHDFRRAELTFLHQRVIDPRNMTLTTITPIPAGVDDMAMDFIGPPIPAHQIAGLATGTLDPITREPVVDIMPDREPSASQQSSSKPRSGAFSSAYSKVQNQARDPKQPTLNGFFQKSSQTATSSHAGSSAPKHVGRTSIASMLKSTSQPTKSRERALLQPKDMNKRQCSPLLASSPPDASFCLRSRANAFATQAPEESHNGIKAQKRKEGVKEIDTSVVEGTSRYFQLNGGSSREAARVARQQVDDEMEALETVSSAAGSSPVKSESDRGAGKGVTARQRPGLVDFSQYLHGAGSTWDCDDLSSNTSSHRRKRQRLAGSESAHDAEDIEEVTFQPGQRPSPRSVIRERQKMLSNNQTGPRGIGQSPKSNVTSSPSSSPVLDDARWDVDTPLGRRNTMLGDGGFLAPADDFGDVRWTPLNKGKGKVAVLVEESVYSGVEDDLDFDTPVAGCSQIQHLVSSQQYGRASPHESQLGDDWASEVLIKATQDSEVITEHSDDGPDAMSSSEEVYTLRIRSAVRQQELQRFRQKRPAAVLDFPDSEDIGYGLAYVIKDGKTLNGHHGELGFASQPVQQAPPSGLRMGDEGRTRTTANAAAPPSRPIPKPISRSSSGPASLRSIGEQARMQQRPGRVSLPAHAPAAAEPKRQRLDMMTTQLDNTPARGGGRFEGETPIRDSEKRPRAGPGSGSGSGSRHRTPLQASYRHSG
ncbi:unnamed protein product [Tilletia controversa]|nr:unnamed protein product [Tilletia controversa]CAD6942878.1 unnamed protein product [Tilletia controversa]CAD6977130.1 unnamed protein product [Tilletia controversa]CAD6979094.1 unnamed protein product [Tilletia controversa]